jgi:hypothetical protein
MTCQHLSGGIVVCRPAPGVWEPTEHYESAKWCQKCRRRRVQRLWFRVEIEPSYYEPIPRWMCPCEGNPNE